MSQMVKSQKFKKWRYLFFHGEVLVKYASQLN